MRLDKVPLRVPMFSVAATGCGEVSSRTREDRAPRFGPQPSRLTGVETSYDLTRIRLTMFVY